MKYLFILVLPLIVLCSLVFWFAFPATTSRFLLDINNSSAGLTAKTISTKLGEIHYLEGGQGNTVVLLHGIYARKEHWVDLARELTQDYHVIALDLAGFGDNQRLHIEQYQIYAQATNLGIVLDALEVDKANFGANSMGALVLANLATKRPQLIRTLAFIGSPLGVPTNMQSDMDKALQNDKYPLVVKSKEDFENRNQWLFPRIPILPGPILKTWIQQELVDPNMNELIWHTVHDFSNSPTLLELASTLHMQTITIWCQEDRIFHLSGATILDNVLPNSRVHILKRCGHVPMLDKPKEVGEIYLDFLQQQNQQAI